MLGRHINVGIEVHNEISGVVPEYETLEAAVYCGYTLLDWYELDYFERASLVAQYRLHLSIEAHVNDAIMRDARRQQRRSGRR